MGSIRASAFLEPVPAQAMPKAMAAPYLQAKRWELNTISKLGPENRIGTGTFVSLTWLQLRNSDKTANLYTPFCFDIVIIQLRQQIIMVGSKVESFGSKILVEVPPSSVKNNIQEGRNDAWVVY